MDGLLSFLLFGLFFILMMRFGCGAHMIHGHGDQHGEKEVKHIDPVCGMQVAIDKGYGKMHEGDLYRFCSRECLDNFEADPQRYLKQDEGKGGEA